MFPLSRSVSNSIYLLVFFALKPLFVFRIFFPFGSGLSEPDEITNSLRFNKNERELCINEKLITYTLTAFKRV